MSLLQKCRATLKSLITQHTRASRHHLTPELVLRLLTPECSLWTAGEKELQETPFKYPFWAFYWPGGQATARFILDNQEVVKNRKVLDIGCGCGAGAIAAAKMKATRVMANDIDPVAVAATEINAEMNGVALETSTENFIGRSFAEFDTILIGDMFYDEEFAKLLFDWLNSLAKEGKTVLIGDPGRHGLTEKRREHITLMATYKLLDETCGQNHGFTETTLWRLNGR